MLSHGEWYKLVPRGLEENVKFRLAVLKKCAEDAEFRAGIMAICEVDLIFFIDVFVWQFNPKKKGEEAYLATSPFITWDCQRRVLLDRPETTGEKGILWCYENNKTACVQKSREMGASWLFLILQVWLSIFHDGHQSLNISRNEKMVDSKSPDSLFWKIRRIHKWLPDWMTGPLVEEKMYFEYVRSESYITGEPSTGAAGVGGRGGVAFIDEFPRIKEDTAVRQGTASTADARFFNGTHLGTGTEFYRMSITPEIVQIFLHWTEHPEKWKGAYRYNQSTGQVEILDKTYEFPPDYKFNTTGKPIGGPHPGVRSVWYDSKCADIGSDQGVAQELDINPTGSSGLAFCDVLIQNLVQLARRPIWNGDIVKVGSSDEYKFQEHVGEGEGPCNLWVLPDYQGRLPIAIYKLGCDLSNGTGATPSCVTMLNADTGERIGEYVNANIYPDHLAPLVVWLGRHLKSMDEHGAEIAWEIAGPGIRFGIEVLALGYTNIFWNDNTLTGLPDLSKKTRPGWNAENKAKKLLLNQYEAALRERHFMNFSELALKECLMFEYSERGDKIEHSGARSKNDPSAAGDNHGDRVIADALAWMLAKDITRRRIEEKKDTGPVPYSYEWRRMMYNQTQRRPERSGIYDGILQ